MSGLASLGGAAGRGLSQAVGPQLDGLRSWWEGLDGNTRASLLGAAAGGGLGAGAGYAAGRPGGVGGEGALAGLLGGAALGGGAGYLGNEWFNGTKQDPDNPAASAAAADSPSSPEPTADPGLGVSSDISVPTLSAAAGTAAGFKGGQGLARYFTAPGRSVIAPGAPGTGTRLGRLALGSTVKSLPLATGGAAGMAAMLGARAAGYNASAK